MKRIFSAYKGDYKSILRLGFPILIGQLGMIVVGFADNVMVGRYSTEALASASFVNNIFNVVIFCCIGFTYGITPLVGSMFSRGQFRDIGALMRNGLVLNVVFTSVVTGIMTVIYFNLHRLGQPQELLPLIRPYYLIYMAGLLPVSVFNVFAQWAYGIKRTSMPMWIILAANCVNVLGNWMLIYGKCGAPELGLTGAGISTLVARVLCPVAIILVYFRSRGYERYKAGFVEGRLSRKKLREVWRVSIPISLQMTFESGSFTFAAIMAGWLGKVALAAFQIVVITGTLGFCVYYSIGSAVAVLVANASGLGDNRGMRHVAWAGYHILIALMVVATVIFVFAGRYIMSAFTDDARVLALAVSLIVPLVIYQLGDATQVNFASSLRGTSNVMPMLWIAFISYIVVGLPATYLMAFPMGMGAYGIILSFSVSLFLAAGMFLYFFLRVTRTRQQRSR